ncbi:hypothetical protein KO500_15020 [Cellulophaga baltica]|uniref:hypothetical protein n=1 Tax=Cellulophaga TaxID=104264 RepID=UPI001C071ECB|nr:MULTISPECIES: hypothetical protein [Cellulophaga]MBU2997760.1 hypothetical protein [Cellulophaga baltica]MDO6769156.1 hypothetical protein [Cellulophaga sp. 1_MG-2023]
MKTYPLILILFAFAFSAYSQVKIGDDVSTIDSASLLELESKTMALVLTRVNDSEMLQIIPLNGALVYNTDYECVYVYSGGEWKSLCEGENATTEQEQVVIIATNGQVQFNTPSPIVDSDKIEIYRNGIRIDFTTINENTIQLQSDIVCYQNDKIRIVQIL